jgi:DNA polymerase-1
MQANSLAEYAFDSFGVIMTPLEAQQQLDRLALAYPKLHQWKRTHYQLCQRRGYVEIGCGRVVKAEWEAKKSLWFALCCNLPIQGICADAMMRAIQLTHKRLREARLDAFLVATVHDELLVEARESDAEAAAELLSGAMTDAFVMTFPGFPTVNLLEVRTGTSWAALKSAASNPPLTSAYLQSLSGSAFNLHCAAITDPRTEVSPFCYRSAALAR